MKKLLLLVSLIIFCSVVSAQTPAKKPADTKTPNAAQQKILKEALAQWQKAEAAAKPFRDREDAARSRFLMLVFQAQAEMGIRPSEYGVKSDENGNVTFPRTEPEKVGQKSKENNKP